MLPSPLGWIRADVAPRFIFASFYFLSFHSCLARQYLMLDFSANPDMGVYCRRLQWGQHSFSDFLDFGRISGRVSGNVQRLWYLGAHVASFFPLCFHTQSRSKLNRLLFSFFPVAQPVALQSVPARYDIKTMATSPFGSFLVWMITTLILTIVSGKIFVKRISSIPTASTC